MMGLANPWGLLALASVGVLIALTLLARRARTSVVSSLLLWRQIPARAVERRRFRPDLLFALRLLLLLALAAALARPYRAVPGRAGGDLALVLDVSASMQVHEADGTRLDLARRRADTLVTALPADAAVLLVGAADRPRVALRWSTDRARLAARLAALDALDTPTALAPAVRLALGEASRRPGARVAVVTDLPATATDLSDDEQRAVEWRTVGRRGDNVAITGLDVIAPPFAAARDVTVDVELRNFDAAARTVSLEARVGDEPWLRRAVELAPHATRRLHLDPPPRAGVLHVALDGGGDALAVDDEAVAWIPSEPPLDVLLVTESDALGAAMRSLVGAVPAARLEVVNAAGLREGAGLASVGGVTIYDRVVPSDELPGNALYLAPPPGNAICPSLRAVDDAAVVDWVADHPVLAGLHGLEAVEAIRAVQLLPPDAGAVVMTAASRRAAYPFLIADERGGRRWACLAAELPPVLTTSDALPLALVALNTLRWLAAPAADTPVTVRTGVPARATGAVVADATGDVRAAGDPPIVLATRAGTRRVRGAAGGERLVLASLLDASESDVGRTGDGDHAATAAPSAAPESERQHDLSPWLLSAALLLLVLEWLAWGLLP